MHPARWLLLALLLAPMAAPAADPETPAPVEERLEAVVAEIAALDARAAEDASAAAGARREGLAALEQIYREQLEVLRNREQLRAQEQQTEERLASGPSAQLAKPPPYVLEVLDALADARDAQAQRTETLSAALEAAQRARELADDAVEQAETARRRAAEAHDKAGDAAEKARLHQELEQSELASRAARARGELAALEVGNLERRLELQRRHERLLSDTVGWVRGNLALEAATSGDPAALDDLEFDAQRGLEQAEREAADRERALARAEQRLGDDPTNEARRAEVDALRSELQLWNRRVEAARTELSRLESRRTLEERRIQALSGSASREDLLAWETDLTAERAEIERKLRLLDVRGQELADALSAEQAASGAAPPAERRWLERRVDALGDQRDLLTRERAAWSDLLALQERVAGEIGELTARPSLADRADDARRALVSAWELELFAVDDRSITVGKLSTALLLFVLGFVVARVASGLVGRLLVRRMSLATGAATAIQGLAFYVLLVLFFLAALRSVSIPLTAFTVLGGALAIGVGFGSQNIVNNFISGLILLAERPIKVGDIIEVDGQRGTVEWIGPRSTRVRTFDNIHIIVPNSAFLEKNVVNWTLADDDIRTRVDVGVAYGSPTREVQRLLGKAVAEHGRILERPAPTILFREFGDNALQFRIYFWIRSRDMLERLTIESDVRYRIDHLCREAGITIAFPQRDVHLDATDPIPVQVVGTDDEAQREGGA
ncbi:MAG: mechanosensitive ion channel domain-containing protein [Myxococcota bacterium]